MAQFAAKLDLHKEVTNVKQVQDNHHTVYVSAARKGIVFCPVHPGTWISQPGIFRARVRDCPKCDKSFVRRTDEPELDSPKPAERMEPVPEVVPVAAPSVSANDTNNSKAAETNLNFNYESGLNNYFLYGKCN